VSLSAGMAESLAPWRPYLPATYASGGFWLSSVIGRTTALGLFVEPQSRRPA